MNQPPSLFTLFFLLFGMTMMAQFPEGHYVVPSLNGQYERVLDRAQSPRHHTGYSVGAGLGYAWHAYGWMLEFEANASYATLTPVSSANPLNVRMPSYVGQIKTRFLWNVKTVNKTRILAGVSLPFMLRYREHSSFSNSRETWNAALMVGPEVGVQHHFDWWRKGFIAETFLSVPVWGYASKPAYAQFFGVFWDQTSPRAWNNSVWVQAETRLRLLTINGNQVGLGYVWQYYSDSVDNRAQLADHQLRVFIMAKF